MCNVVGTGVSHGRGAGMGEGPGSRAMGWGGAGGSHRGDPGTGCASCPPALTQKPDIFIPEELEPGRPVKALCVFNLTSELCPAPTFSWMGAAVTTQRTQLRSTHSSVLSFSPRLQDQDTELTCRVDFPLSARSTHESVRLSVRLRLVGECTGAWYPRATPTQVAVGMPLATNGPLFYLG